MWVLCISIWHASYGLLVRESTVTIVVFGLLGAAACYLSTRVLQDPTPVWRSHG